jgi:hypothetical protein
MKRLTDTLIRRMYVVYLLRNGQYTTPLLFFFSEPNLTVIGIRDPGPRESEFLWPQSNFSHLGIKVPTPSFLVSHNSVGLEFNDSGPTENRSEGARLQFYALRNGASLLPFCIFDFFLYFSPGFH